MASRWSAFVMLVVFASACATPRVVHLPPTTNRSVAVSGADFEGSLARLMLEEPLVVHASFSPPAGNTSCWLGKALGGPCRPGQPRNECISLLDDVMGLSQGEKLGLGLGLSLQPMRESIAQALEDTMTPQFFAAAIGAGMVSWAVLAANPEPVFTKVAAFVAAVMVIYLGVDAFLAVVKACQELKRASEEAVTLEEMEEASQRFGAQVGPEVSRVFILALTVMISRGTMGGATWLAGRRHVVGWEDAVIAALRGGLGGGGNGGWSAARAWTGLSINCAATRPGYKTMPALRHTSSPRV
jgi:hypothetical protein